MILRGLVAASLAAVSLSVPASAAQAPVPEAVLVHAAIAALPVWGSRTGRATTAISCGTGSMRIAIPRTFRPERLYDRAAVDLTPTDTPGTHQLLIRRNRTTGELAYYRCFSPRPVPLSVLVHARPRLPRCHPRQRTPRPPRPRRAHRPHLQRNPTTVRPARSATERPTHPSPALVPMAPPTPSPRPRLPLPSTHGHSMKIQLLRSGERASRSRQGRRDYRSWGRSRNAGWPVRGRTMRKWWSVVSRASVR